MEFNLRSVDLNLLPIFLATYEERSLSRAADRLAMTQSAVSHALGRLRRLFKDDLFVRHSRGVLPTPAAEAIYPRLHAAVQGVQQTITEAVAFDPATSVRTLAVAMPHPLGPLLALRLHERLTKSAPGLAVSYDTLTRPTDLDARLADGRCDLAVDWLLPTEVSVRQEVLFEDQLLVMTRAKHPLQAKKVTPERLRSSSFVSIKPRRRVDDASAKAGPWRDFQWPLALEVSELLEVMLVLSESDMVGFVPASMAARAKSAFGLVALRVPFLPPMHVPIHAIWHPRRDADPAHRYLRGEVAGMVRSLIAATNASSAATAAIGSLRR